MLRLKDRNRQIPNGLTFYDAATKYRATPYSSFNVIVQGVIAARLANPGIARSNRLNNDPNVVASEVDMYNALLCKQNGWTDFILGDSGGAPSSGPFSTLTAVGRELKNVAAGREILVDWIASGAEAVAPELANKRAEICVECPLNEKSSLLSTFTVPASEAIRRALASRHSMGLSTPSDSRLGVCSACSCPLRLKIHLPLSRILGKMSQESKDSLAEKCWIHNEQ